MVKSVTTGLFQNLGDSLAAILFWIAYLAIRFLDGIGRDFLEKLPFIGRWLSQITAEPLGWLEGHVFDLAVALTLGLVANLIWEIVSAWISWHSPDPSKTQTIPAPGPLNWVVAAFFFWQFTKLRALGSSIGDFFYWSSWWQIALAILAIILVVAALVAIFAFIWRFWQSRRGGAHTRRRRRRRRR